MKTLQNILSVAVLVLVAGVAYQYLASSSLDHRLGNTERLVEESQFKIESVARDARSQGEAVKKHELEIASHTESLGNQGKDIADLKTRLAAAEARLAELSKSAEADRAEMDRHRSEIEKLRSEVDTILAQSAETERRQRELDDLRRELKKSLERSSALERNSTELERRLIVIEKQLGIERPQP